MMKKAFYFTIVFASLIAAYLPLLPWFFARDDFGFLPHLPTTLNNLATILIPPQNWFFRPLSQQFYFWLGSEIWGLNAMWFRVFALGLLTVNSLLVYKLIRRFSTTTPVLFGLILYGLNTLHLFEIGWVAANYQTISTTLFLLTVLLATSQSRRYRFFSFVTLILAFLASEMSVFIAPMIFAYSSIQNNKQQITNNKLIAQLPNYAITQFKRTWFYFLLTALYLAFYLTYVHLPGGSVYGRYFDPAEMARIFAKYLLYPLVAGFDRSNLFGVVNILLATKAVTIAFVTLIALINKNVNKRLLFLGTAWFLITVSLFTLLKGHSFAYLDAIPSIGLTLIIASLWPTNLSKRLQTTAIVTIIAISLLTLRLAQSTDPDIKWLYERQSNSRTYLTTLTYPINNQFVLDENNTDLMETTYFGHAISVFYKNKKPTIILK